MPSIPSSLMMPLQVVLSRSKMRHFFLKSAGDAEHNIGDVLSDVWKKHRLYIIWAFTYIFGSNTKR